MPSVGNKVLLTGGQKVDATLPPARYVVLVAFVFVSLSWLPNRFDQALWFFVRTPNPSSQIKNQTSLSKAGIY